MAGVDFNIVITDEACTYARMASTNSGWHLVPKKWAITSSSGECSPTRTSGSMFTPWIQQPFSGVYPQGTNRLLNSVIIPPDASPVTMTIGEIYFIYEDYFGNEFLFAIAQPTSSLDFNPGISQSYSFVFALNNTTVPDTFIINYTYPQDIQDHNDNRESHDWLLACDGSRTATDIIKYNSALNFTSNRDIVDKEYVDNLINRVKDLINTTYCPPGSLAWWPATIPPPNWLVRDGSTLNISAHPQLYSVLKNTYGGNGTTTFALPDDRKLFIRGYDSSLGVGFGKIQSSAAPNITGSLNRVAVNEDRRMSYTGCFRQTIEYLNRTAGNQADWFAEGDGTSNQYIIQFNASNSSGVYQAVSEVRPVNRNYLPIIKDDDN